MKADVSQQIQD